MKEIVARYREFAGKPQAYEPLQNEASPHREDVLFASDPWAGWVAGAIRRRPARLVESSVAAAPDDQHQTPERRRQKKKSPPQQSGGEIVAGAIRRLPAHPVESIITKLRVTPCTLSPLAQVYHRLYSHSSSCLQGGASP